MIRLIPACVAALTVAACTTTPPPAPPVDTSLIGRPAAVLMEPPRELPDAPDCSGLDDVRRKACRAVYDARLRHQCVGFATQLTGLQAWVAALDQAPRKF